MPFIVGEVHPLCCENGNSLANLPEDFFLDVSLASKVIPVTCEHATVQTWDHKYPLHCSVLMSGETIGAAIELYKHRETMCWNMVLFVLPGDYFGKYLSLSNDLNEIHEVALVREPGRDVRPIQQIFDNYIDLVNYVSSTKMSKSALMKKRSTAELMEQLVSLHQGKKSVLEVDNDLFREQYDRLATNLGKLRDINIVGSFAASDPIKSLDNLNTQLEAQTATAADGEEDTVMGILAELRERKTRELSQPVPRA